MSGASRVLLLGIGHPFRHDDAIGPVIAESVAALGLPHVTVLAHHGEGMDLLERWAGFDRVLLVDATCSGQPAGTIAEWDAAAADLPTGLFPKGSHIIGPAEGIAMARVLGRLPQWLRVVGVEGRDFTAGQGFTPDVATAMPAALARVVALLGRL